MKQYTNTTAMKGIVLFLSFLFLSICFNDVLVIAEENESEAETGHELAGEMMKGVEGVMAQHENRKKALKELVSKPLTETQQVLLAPPPSANGYAGGNLIQRVVFGLSESGSWKEI